jgi:hypothetical protein
MDVGVEDKDITHTHIHTHTHTHTLKMNWLFSSWDVES